MKNIRLFLYSLLWGNPELFFLDQVRLGAVRFFREKKLPGQIPVWQGRRPSRAALAAGLSHVAGGSR